jgi:hypothetical protein
MTDARPKTDREQLWEMLDNISTLDDVCKGNDSEYRRLVRAECEKRNRVGQSFDGYTITWVNPGMDLARILHVVRYYDAILDRMAIGPAMEWPDLRVLTGSELPLQHIRSMITRLIPMIEDEPGRREKIMRWFSFVQCALWMEGTFTVNELKEHSRPDAELPRA